MRKVCQISIYFIFSTLRGFLWSIYTTVEILAVKFSLDGNIVLNSSKPDNSAVGKGDNCLICCLPHGAGTSVLLIYCVNISPSPIPSNPTPPSLGKEMSWPNAASS